MLYSAPLGTDKIFILFNLLSTSLCNNFGNYQGICHKNMSRTIGGTSLNTNAELNKK